MLEITFSEDSLANSASVKGPVYPIKKIKKASIYKAAALF